MQRERRRDMWNSFSLSPSLNDPATALIRRECLGVGEGGWGDCFPSFIARFRFISFFFPQTQGHISLICARWRWRQSVLGFPSLPLSLFSERLCLEPDPRERRVMHVSVARSSRQSSDVLKWTRRLCSTFCLCALRRQAPRGPYLLIGCDIK